VASMRLKHSLFALAAVAAATLTQSSAAHAQSCPAGRTCFYVPPGMPIPTTYSGVGWDMVLAAPRGAITGTYRLGFTGMDTPFTVMPGTPLIVPLGTDAAARGIATAYATTQNNGIFIVASSGELIVDHREIVGPWQSSSTIKSGSYSLGTRFRAAGYALNQTSNPNTGHDYVSVYSPNGATVTFTAPPGVTAPFWADGIAGLTHTVTLAAGQTYMIRTQPGCRELHGALVTSTDPVSVESGGRGWSGGTGSCQVGGGCGDDGADHLIPSTGIGRQYVVEDFPTSGADGERVHVIADVDGTSFTINGGAPITLMAGQTHTFNPSGLSYIQSNVPVYVYEESGLDRCETDLAAIPPVVLAPVGTWQTDFNIVGTGQISVIIATANVASFTLRRGMTTLTAAATTAVPGRADLTRLSFTGLSAGNYSARANGDFQLGLVTSAGGTGLFAYYTPFRIPGCGDAMRSMTEGCDDGNLDNGDGCSDACRIEVGSPLMCGMTSDCVPTGRCDPTGRCVSRCMTTADCDDRDECTTDACTLATGVCANTALPRGSMCTGGSCGIAAAGSNIVCVSFANDLDRDSIADSVDADDDNDGIPDAVEGNSDPDGDMIPASRDTDSDGDGLTDMFESGSAMLDANGDGRIDMPTDNDSDGLASAFDTNDMDRAVISSRVTPRNSDAMVPASDGAADMLADFLDSDDDGDGVLTRDELGAGGAMMPANSDADGSVPDFLDTDSDNDCVPDRAMSEAGAARTDPAMPSAMANANCTDAMLPICNRATGRCIADNDSDMDGIPDMVETRIGTNPMNADSDMDGVPDGAEVGAGPGFTTRDTDMDGMHDALDNDDDGDGVPTRDELGAGGAMMPSNSNAMVAMGEGTSNMLPDYLDPDDDGDGIPTRVERTLEGMTDRDGDMIPAYLDRDSDGDTVPDATERGMDGATPTNTDGAMDGADFLDTDSDNDCALDRAMNEAGAARTDPTMPSAMADANCMDPTPVCNRATGACEGRTVADAGVDGSSGDSGAVMDASADASRDAGSVMDASADAGRQPGVVSGDGACACRAPAAPMRANNTALLAAAAAAACVVGARRRARRLSA
jgi:cysteine-rich repeat protein